VLPAATKVELPELDDPSTETFTIEGSLPAWVRFAGAYVLYPTIDVMTARVYVSFKTTVLDPQGQTIRGALNGLGHRSIAEVRQGKFFDIEIAPGTGREDAAREMDQIARDVLANPVIEDYRVEFLD